MKTMNWLLHSCIVFLLFGVTVVLVLKTMAESKDNSTSSLSENVLIFAKTNQRQRPVPARKNSLRRAPEVAMAPMAPQAPSESVDPADSGAGDLNIFKQNKRMMAYTASLVLVVKSQEKALAEVKKAAESLKGYLLSLHQGSMNIKVPAAQGDEFLKRLKALGKVRDFQIFTDDLTDTITDLNVRLDNLRKLRTRLTELFAKTQKVEEMLQIERELNRVTTEIERLAAELKNNQNRVNYIVLTIEIVEEGNVIPGGTPLAIEQFGFLDRLAQAAHGKRSTPLFGIEAPDDFVAMRNGTDSSFAAISSDDCVFRTWKAAVAGKSTLEFWKKIICRSLQVKNSFSSIKVTSAALAGEKAFKITALMTTSRGVQSYMAIVALKECWGDDELRFVEFFGPEEAFKLHIKAVENKL